MEHDHYDIVVNYIIANQKKFYRLAYTYVRNENDALDIVQNLQRAGALRVNPGDLLYKNLVLQSAGS